MKKLILALVVAGIAGGVYAQTNTVPAENNNYIALRGGIAQLNDVEDVEFETGFAGGIAIGKFFKSEKFAIELELKHQRNEYTEYTPGMDGTIGTLAVEGTVGTDAIPGTPGTPFIAGTPGTPDIPAVDPVGPQKPGNGKGHGWGWWRRHPGSSPGTPAIPGTPGTPDIPATPGTPDIPAVPGTAGTDAVEGTPATAAIYDNGYVRSTALLINAYYRIVNDTFITPYLMAGTGVRYTEATGAYSYYDSSAWVYQAGVGVDFELSEQFSVDLNARYAGDVNRDAYEQNGPVVLVGLVYQF